MPITLAKIRTMGQNMISQLQGMLQDLAFNTELPTVPLDKLIDSMAWSSEFRRTDYSFINHSKNPASIRVGHSWLFAAAQKAQGRWKLFATDSYKAK